MAEPAGDAVGEGPFRPVSPPNHCDLGPRRIVLTGYLCDALRRHFAWPDLIEEAALAGSTSPPDDKGSGLAIEAAGKWKGELANHRPALIVKGNAWPTQRIALAHNLGNDPDGSVVRGLAFVGSHTIICLARDSGEAELLGEEVAGFFIAFGEQIRQRFPGLNQLTLAELGVVHTVRGGGGGYAVPVTLAYHGVKHVQVRPEASVLQAVSFNGLLP